VSADLIDKGVSAQELLAHPVDRHINLPVGVFDFPCYGGNQQCVAQAGLIVEQRDAIAKTYLQADG